MNRSLTLLLAFASLLQAETGQEPGNLSTKIAVGSEELALEQDELAADVMELVEEQTVPQVIKMLEEVEIIMAEVTDELIEENTGGDTIAAQTEIIEKIFGAAKQRQQSSGKSGEESKESMDAMLDMMQRMMGQEPGEGEGPPQEGQQPGEQSGEGMTGDSDSANEDIDGTTSGESGERVIPRNSGQTGRGLPSEFQELLDAYNSNNR